MVVADSGYVSEDNLARADTGGLRLLAPLGKDPDRHSARTPQQTLHLDRLPATARAAAGPEQRQAADPGGRLRVIASDVRRRSAQVDDVRRLALSSGAAAA